MRKLLIILLLCSFGMMHAQQEKPTKKQQDDPVREPWSAGTIINHQTEYIPHEKSFELIMNHRFGSIKNGLSDIFGVMAPGATIRIGLNYSIKPNLLIGFGTSNLKKYQDLQLKWRPFEQTVTNSMPVSMTFYGNMGIQATKEEDFGKKYQFTDRFSYFGEMIIGRKINDLISVKFSGNYTHYNSVTEEYPHDVIGLGWGGRMRISPRSVITFEGGLPLYYNRTHPKGNKPHLGLGYEVSTYTHTFQFFITNTASVLALDLYLHHQEGISEETIRIGFNINRIW